MFSHVLLGGVMILVSVSLASAQVEETTDHDGGEILFEEFEVPQLKADGTQAYRFSFETKDGTRREEMGEADPEKGVSVIGTYSYIRPDGIVEEVFYTAGTKGFALISKVEYYRFFSGQRIPAPALASLAG